VAYDARMGNAPSDAMGCQTRRGRLALALVILIGGAGCANGNQAVAGSAAGVLHRAASATLALRSFRVTVTAAGEATASTAYVVVIDYNAPDRMRSVGPRSRVVPRSNVPLFPDIKLPRTEMIVIGTKSYFSVPDKPGFYYVYRGSAKTSTDPVLGMLRSAEEVGSSGGLFTFSETMTSSPLSGVSAAAPVVFGVSGVAGIRDGLVEWVTLDWETEGSHSVVVYRFSMFDSAPIVSAPPHDHVLALPTLPPCEEDGGPLGGFVCSPTSSASPAVRAP
jgi:hypothetical protein